MLSKKGKSAAPFQGDGLKKPRWHQDIKPANILCQLEDGQSPYNCRFKLADLGLSHFVADSEETALSFDTRGTRTYG